MQIEVIQQYLELMEKYLFKRLDNWFLFSIATEGSDFKSKY